MEQPLVTVENVRNLQANGKRLLEDMLGRTLQDNQQVFIMVLSPACIEPEEATRRQARAGLEATFRKTEAYAQEHGVTDEEIAAAIEEATQQIRPKKA